MKEILLMYAKYTQRANESVLALLDGLSPEERDADRKSYYKSLSGLASHEAGCALYFLKLFRSSSPAAAAEIKGIDGLKIAEKKALTQADWSELRKVCSVADQATVELIRTLSEKELARPLKIDWYGGKPDSVPLCFLLHQSFVHGTHHRGQISQVLDEMGIEHDFSGIDIEFLPS
jgi:uncharacterized damage-inducible protein DinB